jgi:hypothetical protein
MTGERERTAGGGPGSPWRPVRVGDVVKLAVVLLFFVAAPTAGDIGSCGQPSDDLDPTTFFEEKQQTDCTRCMQCDLTSMTCQRACEPALVTSMFAQGCIPAVHDGEVCIDALMAASCSQYAQYTADVGSTIPTECDFCPAGSP